MMNTEGGFASIIKKRAKKPVTRSAAV